MDIVRNWRFYLSGKCSKERGIMNKKHFGLRAGFSLLMGMSILGLAVPAATAGATTKPKTAFSWTVNESNCGVCGATPTFIYPYMDGADFTSTNGGLQYAMYKPLYWFGTAAGVVAPNYPESLAKAPVMSNGGLTATITLNNYNWSDGAPVQAKDVIEWLNIMAAFPSQWGNYGAPVNGANVSVPDIIKSINVISPKKFVLNLNTKVNATWLVMNPLSNITPLPQAWDIIPSNYDPTTTPGQVTLPITNTAAGCWSDTFIGNGNLHGPTAAYVDTNGYDTVANAAAISSHQANKCQEVWFTMAAYATDTANWADTSTTTGQLWAHTDGAFKLATFDEAAGNYSLVRSATYGGPRNAKSPTKLNFIDCHDVTGDCQTLLQTGQVDIGGIPSSAMAKITRLSQAPTAHVNITLPAGYKKTVSYSWAVGYSWMNETSVNTGAHDDSGLAPNDTTTRGALFAQNYIRVVLNDTYPAQQISNQQYRGYAYPTFGPIPPYPANTYTSVTKDPYTASAIAGIMKAHGWKLQNFIWTCVKGGAGTGHCGLHIAAGAKMVFKVDGTGAGSSIATSADLTWKGSAAANGVDLQITEAGFGAVVHNDNPHHTGWDMYTGSGWIYAPGFEPTGEPLFLTGASSNAGTYSVPLIDKDIVGTIQGTVTLDKYERDYLANPPAVGNVWTVGVVAYSPHLGGYVPQASGMGTPELWHYVS